MTLVLVGSKRYLCFLFQWKITLDFLFKVVGLFVYSKNDAVFNIEQLLFDSVVPLSISN